jgi:hypothetical protein
MHSLIRRSLQNSHAIYQAVYWFALPLIQA